ncbi:hypothetical protein D3C71_1326290 [compost metagenome]
MASLRSLNTRRTSAPSSDAALKPGAAEATDNHRLSAVRMRSRRSSHSVRASPGFTETDTSIMSRAGQIGSLMRMFSGIRPSCVAGRSSAGRSMATPSRPSCMFSQLYAQLRIKGCAAGASPTPEGISTCTIGIGLAGNEAASRLREPAPFGSAITMLRSSGAKRPLM